MSHSMDRKRKLRSWGFCTQCGLDRANGWRCAACRAKQAAAEKAKRDALKVSQTPQPFVPQCSTE